MIIHCCLTTTTNLTSFCYLNVISLSLENMNGHGGLILGLSHAACQHLCHHRKGVFQSLGPVQISCAARSSKLVAGAAG